MSRKSLEKIGQERIADLQKESGLAVAKLAEACGVTRAGFYKWMKTGCLPKDGLMTLMVLSAFPEAKVIKRNPTEDFDVARLSTENIFKIIPADNAGKPIFVAVEYNPPSKETKYSYGSIGIHSLVSWNKSRTKILRTDLMDYNAPKLVLPTGLHSQEEIIRLVLEKCSLDELTKEIERRGWTVSLSNQKR